MSVPLTVRPEAEADLSEALCWYENQRPGLGEEFLLCVEEACERIARLPRTFPKVHKNCRRALVRRFPYGVFYVVEAKRVVVLAVLHARRDPKEWQART